MKGFNPEMMKKLQYSKVHSCVTSQESTTQLERTCSYKQCDWAMGQLATDYHHGKVGPQLCPHWRNTTAMSNNEQHTLHTHLREEREGRIKVDKADRLSLRNTLDVCSNPLDDD